MADHSIAHFHNDPGVPTIRVRVKEFMCTGAKPPFDHPHIFIDMGRRQRGDLLLLLDPFRLRRRTRGVCVAARMRAQRGLNAWRGARSSPAPESGASRRPWRSSQAGFDVTVYERAGALEEFGAGLQLTPNATRVLARLGALDEVRETAMVPDAVVALRG